MTRLLLLVCLCGLLSGCFSGKFSSRLDPFTGKLTKDGRVAVLSTIRQTYWLHARAVGDKKSIQIYVVNQAPVTIDRLDILAGATRIKLTCLFVTEGQKGHYYYRLFQCDLDAPQAAALADAPKVRFRALGIVGASTAPQRNTLARVLR